MFFRKKAATRTFNDVLTTLGAHKFDVSPAKDASAGAYRVTKYGCAAEIAPTSSLTWQKKAPFLRQRSSPAPVGCLTARLPGLKTVATRSS